MDVVHGRRLTAGLKIREETSKQRNRPAGGSIFFISRNIKDAQTSQNNNVYPPAGLNQPGGRLQECFDQGARYISLQSSV